jgi:hypothetical protein
LEFSHILEAEEVNEDDGLEYGKEYFHKLTPSYIADQESEAIPKKIRKV